jgi:hypothetical protein
VTPLEREKDLTSSYSKEKGEAQTQTQTQTQKQRKVKGQEMTPHKKTRRSHAKIKLKIIFGEAMPKKKEQIALENKSLAADDVTIMYLYV